MPQLRPRQLQIFGERCSGTNYIAQLLRRNVPGLRLTDEFGWKHGWADRVSGPQPECVFVVVHRDPFDWVRSLHQKPWHAAPSLRGVRLSDFLRQPWWCEWGQDMELAAGDPRLGTEMMHERDPATGQRFANVMALRTAKLRAWLALTERVRHAVLVRYEEAAAEPRRFVRAFARQLGLWRWPWLRAVTTWKGGRERFTAREYEPFASGDVEWVASQLDHDLERRFGIDVVARAAQLSAAAPGTSGRSAVADSAAR